MSQNNDAHIYVGRWVNHDHGNIIGSTITLSSRHGSILIAFLGIFVTAAGAACWRILSYLSHQVRAKQAFQDGIDCQQQVILRNSTSDLSAIKTLAEVAFRWRRIAGQPYARTLPLLGLALGNFIVFWVAGILSSQVIKSVGDEVLVEASNCGYVLIDPGSPTYQTGLLNDTLTASTYARACYSTQSSVLECSRYATPQIKWTTNSNASCPFVDELCIYGATAAYELDTGMIDSHSDLGMNAPKKDRVQIRKVTTCSPIYTAGYSQEVNLTSPNEPNGGVTLLNLYYGEIPGVANYTLQYNEYTIYVDVVYVLNSFIAFAGAAGNGWIPVPALNRSDADVSLFILAGNSVSYVAPVTDPFFNATAEFPPIPTASGNLTLYVSSQYLNALACADQIQYCNPVTNRCTLLTSTFHATDAIKDLNFNDRQIKTAALSNINQQKSNTYSVVQGRGAIALQAYNTLSDRQQIALPNNQWMIEVHGWMAVSMAKLQQLVVQYATGPPYLAGNANETFVKANNTIDRSICGNQKIRNISGGTQSFSVLGIAIVLIVGMILLLVGFTIDTVVGFFQRRFRIGAYKRLQWTLDQQLQLHRLAYEAAGQGTWTGGTSSVPITKPEDLLGIPDGVDRDHPRLEPRRNMTDSGAEDPLMS